MCVRPLTSFALTRWDQTLVQFLSGVLLALSGVGGTVWLKAQGVAENQAGWRILSAQGEPFIATDWEIEGSDWRGTVAGALRQIPLETLQLIEAIHPDEMPAGIWEIRLTDASVLKAQEVLSPQRDLEIKLGSGETLALRRRDVTWFRKLEGTGLTADPAPWIRRENEGPHETDALGVVRDNQWRWVEGTVGRILADQVEFTVDDQKANVKRERIAGIFFADPDNSETRRELARVQLADGSLWKASTMRTVGGRLVLENLRGAELNVSLSALRSLDFGGSRWVWLSDLPATTLDWKPLLAPERVVEPLRKLNLPRLNRNYQGNPLELISRTAAGFQEMEVARRFEHGLALRGGCRVAFALQQEFVRLQGLVGFAPQAAGGKVRLRVLGDGKSCFEQVLEADTTPGVWQVDVDIKGIQRLVIEVDYEDGRAIGDELHLCDWKVSR